MSEDVAWQDQVQAATADLSRILAELRQRENLKKVDKTPLMEQIQDRAKERLLFAIEHRITCPHVDMDRPRPEFFYLGWNTIVCNDCMKVTAKKSPPPDWGEFRCDGCNTSLHGVEPIKTAGYQTGRFQVTVTLCPRCAQELGA